MKSLNRKKINGAFTGKPPECSIDGDVEHYKPDMRNSFIHNAHISDDHKWRLVQSGIQGATHSPFRIFKVLCREFKRRQLLAVELHGLQQ